MMVEAAEGFTSREISKFRKLCQVGLPHFAPESGIGELTLAGNPN